MLQEFWPWRRSWRDRFAEMDDAYGENEFHFKAGL